MNVGVVADPVDEGGQRRIRVIRPVCLRDEPIEARRCAVDIVVEIDRHPEQCGVDRSHSPRHRRSITAETRREPTGPQACSDDPTLLADRGLENPFDHAVHQRVRQRKAMPLNVGTPFMGDVHGREGDDRAVERRHTAQIPCDGPEMLNVGAALGTGRPPPQIEDRGTDRPADHAEQWLPGCRVFPSTHV